jgi:electron transfer flavoprotein alpha subunit
MPSILTYAEHRDGTLRRASLEVVSEARRLADQMGGGTTVESVLIGTGVAPLAATLAAHGSDRVHVVEAKELASYATEGYARAVAQLISQEKPKAVLFPYTAMGKDLAPRVAARVGAGLVSDVVKLTVKDGKLQARRPMYAGKAFATVEWVGEPQMATLRPNVFPLAAADGARKFETATANVDVADQRAKVVSLQASAAGKVELTEAQIVVSGGRGLKGPENFHLIEELAGALGAAVGASRAVVDAGWVDHHFQVGQTGKTVSPSLYIAAGISGAIQHLAGMSSSKVIVAINKDADAPIFKVADYGLVGDLFEILPKLTAAAKTSLAGRK